MSFTLLDVEETRSVMTRRGKLLIPLILTIAVSCSGWQSAHASPPVQVSSGQDVGIGPKPQTTPCSGEPDVGQYKTPPPKGVLIPVISGPDGGASFSSWIDRFLWISRIWMARFLGVR